jgi:hypothetical protein
MRRIATASLMYCLAAPAVSAEPLPLDYPSIDHRLAGYHADSDRRTYFNPLSQRWLTAEQVRLLNAAYRIGHADGGRAHALLLQGMLMRESLAGDFGRIGDIDARVGRRSYGVLQVKVGTAGDVLAAHPALGRFDTAEALIIRLVTDDLFNIRVASKHLALLRRRADSDGQAVMAYNLGLRRARTVTYEAREHRYVRGVYRYIARLLIGFNRHYGNGTVRLAEREEP